VETLQRTSKGYLLLADVSGYTEFLTRAELDHAEDILRGLVGTLVDHVRAPFTVVEVEGDAVFGYAPADATPAGDIVLDTVEETYCSFVEMRDRMYRNSTCTCTACSLIPTLDLKFAAHFGEFVLQSHLRGHAAKPTGPDVILVHRLLKNAVREATGVEAYALLTDALVREGGLESRAADLPRHAERYDHIGEVQGVVYDLGPVWQRESERRRTRVAPGDAWLVQECEIPAPPAVVWEYLTDPAHKQHWLHADAITVSGANNGRTGLGTVHHCAHGNTTIVVEVIDWRPLDYVTYNQAWPMGSHTMVTDEVVAIESGTLVRTAAVRPSGRHAVHDLLVVRPFYAIMKRQFMRQVGENLESLRALVAENADSVRP
jgi:uncharacterized protein YndB with AHSA1/START domain